MQHYENLFKNKKWSCNKILEIGIGGFEDSNTKSSLHIWKYYFPFSNIYGIDIYDKSQLNCNRIKTFKGSQSDTRFLKYMIDEVGNFDIIIDDGSHKNHDVITSFKFLFEYLNLGGYYIIEDSQTSYWKKFGGNSDLNTRATTTMNFFKSLADGINHKEFLIPGYKATYFDLNITMISFYHNLIVIKKELNNEPSNCVINNEKLVLKR